MPNRIETGLGYVGRSLNGETSGDSAARFLIDYGVIATTVLAELITNQWISSPANGVIASLLLLEFFKNSGLGLLRYRRDPDNTTINLVSNLRVEGGKLVRNAS